MTRPFFETLRSLRNGLTLDECGDALAEVVRAVTETNKSGEVVIRIRVRPPRQGSANYLSLDAEVTAKAPKLDRQETIFFPLPDGSLTRQDPTQRPLDLRPVGGAPAVDPETGEILTA